MYLSENFLIASLSPLTTSLSSNNRLIWARGWKSSGGRALVGFALQHCKIAFPSFYSSYILAHFQVFTVQSRATQLTTLCADQRGYMSNTSSLLFSVPVIFVLDRQGGRVRCFSLGISEGSCINPFQEVAEGHDFFRLIILKYPGSPPPPPPPIKNVPSLKQKKTLCNYTRMDTIFKNQLDCQKSKKYTVSLK